MVTCNDCYHYEACKKIFQIAFKDFTNYIFVKGCELYKSTADVAEVKHGEWIDTGSFDHHKTPIYECPVCRREVADNYINLHKYCLHCGAKMDRKED